MGIAIPEMHIWRPKLIYSFTFISFTVKLCTTLWRRMCNFPLPMGCGKQSDQSDGLSMIVNIFTLAFSSIYFHESLLQIIFNCAFNSLALAFTFSSPRCRLNPLVPCELNLTVHR